MTGAWGGGGVLQLTMNCSNRGMAPVRRTDTKQLTMDCVMGEGAQILRGSEGEECEEREGLGEGLRRGRSGWRREEVRRGGVGMEGSRINGRGRSGV